MPDDINKIELRSEEVQEILGHIPSRIIRYGITVIFLVIVVIIAGCFFFTYPDILTAPVEITSQNPPAILVARANGALSQITVADSQKVIKGGLLAIIQNPANYSDMMALQDRLDNIDEKRLLDVVEEESLSFPDNWQLGEVQDVYSSFIKVVNEYQLFLSMDYNHQKINALTRQRMEYDKYIQVLEKQSELKKQEHQVNKLQFQRDSLLFQKGVTSKLDYENACKTFLQSEMDYQSVCSSIIEIHIDLQGIQQQIEDLKTSQQKETAGYRASIHELLTNLKAQVSSWNDSYIFRSPMDGIVAFTKFRDINQVVKSGDEVFTVIPDKQGPTIGRITISGSGIGKIKTGQRVNIKFDNFPYMEFGMVLGSVSTVSMVPSGKDYVVEVKLPVELKTNYNRILPFSQQMPGTAEIVTDDLPLIMRIFNPLKSAYKSHSYPESH